MLHSVTEPRLPEQEWRDLSCRSHLGVWSAWKRGLVMTPLHMEWANLRMDARRLALIAPRAHAKTETFTIDGTVWESIYNPGIWTYVFASTSDQAEEMLDRIKLAMQETEPWMVHGATENSTTHIKFANGARVDVAGAGKAVRGDHPDRIVGDDVMEEKNAATALQRKRLERWWLGTVGGMSHPGTYRTLGEGRGTRQVWMDPTRVFLVGTPFHQQDLLMSMRTNPLYEFRRYAAEYDPADLVPGTLALEIT